MGLPYFPCALIAVVLSGSVYAHYQHVELLHPHLAKAMIAVCCNWIWSTLAGYGHEHKFPLAREFGFTAPVVGTLVAVGWIYANTSLRDPPLLFATFFLTFFSSLAFAIVTALSQVKKASS